MYHRQTDSTDAREFPAYHESEDVIKTCPLFDTIGLFKAELATTKDRVTLCSHEQWTLG